LASRSKCAYSASSMRTPTWRFLIRVSLMVAHRSIKRLARLAATSQNCADFRLIGRAIGHEKYRAQISSCAALGSWANAGRQPGSRGNRGWPRRLNDGCEQRVAVLAPRES
jgi:hypothetical protein